MSESKDNLGHTITIVEEADEWELEISSKTFSVIIQVDEWQVALFVVVKVGRELVHLIKPQRGY